MVAAVARETESRREPCCLAALLAGERRGPSTAEPTPPCRPTPPLDVDSGVTSSGDLGGLRSCTRCRARTCTREAQQTRNRHARDTPTT